jgi:hypothetical protein
MAWLAGGLRHQADESPQQYDAELHLCSFLAGCPHPQDYTYVPSRARPRYRARWVPLRSRGGQAKSPGNGVLQQRKLHVRGQHLHLGVMRLLPPRLCRAEPSCGQARAQWVPIERRPQKRVAPVL